MRKRIASVLLAAIYYLGLHNGYLALFDEDQKKPLMILPYRAELYSQTDQAALQQGIPCETPQELSRVLEDFLS